MKRSPLQRWQDRMGFTQAQAADALGMTREYFLKLAGGKPMNGVVCEPSRQMLLAAAALEYGLKPIR